jgi:hypothetical protein
MSKAPAGQRKADGGPKQVRTATSPNKTHWLRRLLVGNVAGFLVAPLIGMYTGFLLLFAGIFLGAAWQVGPQPLIDSARYATFTATVTGRIVESWMALEFDPADLKPEKNWHGRARIAPCAIVEYTGDWGAPLRRAFCGNRFDFSDDLRFYDWTTLEPGVPFGWLRDASGFALQEIRMSKPALDWLAAHPPHDTFILRKPPPTTALDELKEQLDRPIDVAVASWSAPLPPFPLAYDPRHPDEPMPAQHVKDRRQAAWLGGLVFTVILGGIGLMVWRLGLSVLLFGEQSRVLIWLLTIAPLAALPWWGDVLPKVLRHLSSDWADIGSGMLDDITRTTRLIASPPDEATLAEGEHLVLHVNTGVYADTFGRIHFTLPDPAPKSADLALAALQAQANAQVQQFDAGEQAALFARLEQEKQAGLDNAQAVFTPAAEDILRNINGDPTARRAVRHFLLFSAGYNEWDVDALEKARPPPGS